MEFLLGKPKIEWIFAGFGLLGNRNTELSRGQEKAKSMVATLLAMAYTVITFEPNCTATSGCDVLLEALEKVMNYGQGIALAFLVCLWVAQFIINSTHSWITLDADSKSKTNLTGQLVAQLTIKKIEKQVGATNYITHLSHTFLLQSIY